MSDTKISEAAVEAALSAKAGTWQVRDMLACDESEHADVMEIALAAALPHLHPQPAELAFDVEAMLTACVPGGSIVDPQVVADNIRAWPAERKPAELAEQQRVEIASELRKELDKHRQVNGLSLTPYGRLLLKAAEVLESRHTNRGGEVTGWTLVEGVAVYSVATCSGIEDQQFVRYSDYLAATGKQQVGEVQGDALVTDEMVQTFKAALSRAQLPGKTRTYFLKDSELPSLLREVLAARQPVGQEPVAVPVAYMSHCDIRGKRLTVNQPEGKSSPLYPHPTAYAAPPAQVIDLGQLPDGWSLRTLATCYQLSDGNQVVGNFVGPDAKKNAALIAALIEQRDAAPGVE